MREIALEEGARALAIEALRDWFATELEQEISAFRAGLLVDFAGRELGAHWYNQGLLDARAAFERRVEEIGETIVELERVPPSERGRR